MSILNDQDIATYNNGAHTTVLKALPKLCECLIYIKTSIIL